MARERIAIALAVVGLGLFASSATASFHLNKIREVRAGATPFVELQSYAPGQNVLAPHKVTTYSSSGALVDTVVLSNVAEGASQRTTLIAAGPVDGVSPDVAGTLTLGAPGGAVCFDAVPVDCVAFGSFTGAGALPGAVGSPVPGYPADDGTLSITRSIAAGCATLLESSDDTDDSAADFVVGSPTPRHNASAPTETPCSPGPGPGGDTKAPETTITKQPQRRSPKRKVKIGFESNESGSSFKCSVDGRAFSSCVSPFRSKVKLGKHKFEVFAIDYAGNPDKSPAKVSFRRVARH